MRDLRRCGREALRPRHLDRPGELVGVGGGEERAQVGHAGASPRGQGRQPSRSWRSRSKLRRLAPPVADEGPLHGVEVVQPALSRVVAARRRSTAAPSPTPGRRPTPCARPARSGLAGRHRRLQAGSALAPFQFLAQHLEVGAGRGAHQPHRARARGAMVTVSPAASGKPALAVEGHVDLGAAVVGADRRPARRARPARRSAGC